MFMVWKGTSGGRWRGLAFWTVLTHFDSYEKRTVQVEGELNIGQKGKVRGYEIHMGRTDNRFLRSLFLIKDGEKMEPDGAVSEDGMVMGTYMHGSFDLPAFRRHFLGLVKKERTSGDECEDYDAMVDAGLDRLAQAVRENVDMTALMNILGAERRSG